MKSPLYIIKNQLKIFIIVILCISPTVAHYAQNQPQNYTLLLQLDTQEEKDISNDFFPNQSSYNDITTLKSQYDNYVNDFFSKGYIDLTHTLTKQNDTIYIGHINLGSRYETLRLGIPQEERLRAIISLNQLEVLNDSIEIPLAFAKAYLQELTDLSSNNGQPFASFSIAKIEKSGNILSGILTTEMKAKRLIDEITINGYSALRKSYLKYYARITPKTTFNKELLIKKSKLLSSLPFVRETKEPEVLFTKDSTKVYYYLEKANANSFDGLLSFTNDDDNFKLNGYINLALINNFNYGESISINYLANQNDQSELNASIGIPYILNLPIGIETGLKIFRKDSSFSNTTASAKLTYQIDAKHLVETGISHETSENLQGLNDSIDSYSKNNYSISYRYRNSQASTLFPIKSSAALTLGYSLRTTNNKIPQYNLHIEGHTIFNLNLKNSIYIKAMGKSLFSDSYLFNELYRFGGDQNIRGVAPNSIFANWYSSISTEYRYTLNNNFYINTITDGGYYENNIANNSNLITTLGIGSGIKTKAGLLKVNLLNAKFSNEVFTLKNTQLSLKMLIIF